MISMKKTLSVIAAAAVMLSAAAALPADSFAGENIAVTASAVSKLRAPDGFTYSAAGSGKIALAWNTVKGADAYVIYKFDSSTGKWKKLASTKKNMITVSNIKKGREYYYKVAALDKINGKYYRGYFTDFIKVEYNYTAPSAASDSAAVATDAQQEMLVNYYTKLLAAGTDGAKSLGVKSSSALLANAQQLGGQVMLVRYVMDDDTVVTYGYCITNGSVTQITAAPLASSDNKNGPTDIYFVKEKGTNSYYLFEENNSRKNYSTYRIGKADVWGFIQRYEITVYGGAIYYLDGENTDVGTARDIIDSFDKCSQNDGVNILK